MVTESKRRLSGEHSNAIIAAFVYLLTVVALASAAAWLLAPAPALESNDAIQFYNTSQADSFNIELQQYPDGQQLLVIQNAGKKRLYVQVALYFPASKTPPQTFEEPSLPIGEPSVLPISSVPISSVGKRGVCSKERNNATLNCSFMLEPTGIRGFEWPHPAASWVSHRGSRWSVSTPLVQDSTGYPFEAEQVLSAKYQIVAMLPLPRSAAVVSGPQFSWDVEEDSARFSQTGAGQIDAPLITDYDAQRQEDFVTFLIAAILGAVLGAFPQLINYVRDSWKAETSSRKQSD